MKRILFAILIPLILPAARAEDFEAFVQKRLEQKRLHLPSLLGGGIYKPEPVVNEDFAELRAFYKDKLALHDDDQFYTERLAPIFRMPQGRPVRPYYNDFLVWVKRKDKFLFILRPVDTVTGCDSACAPIVYHLVMDPKGRVTDLLEEPKEPLRKIFHTLMTPKDKEKLLKILKRLPEAYRGIDHPDRLTNSFTTFPPQTWTFFAPSVVEGAAYTSYRIYESALQVQQRMKNKDNELDLLTDLYGKLFRVNNLQSAQSFIDEVTANKTVKKMGPNTESFAVSAFYEILVYLAQERMLSPEILKKLLKSRRDNKNEIQHQCALIRDLFPYPELTPIAIENAVNCPKDIRALYSDLVKGKYGESSMYQTPPFLLKDEKAFFFFLNKFQSEKKNPLALQRMRAEALVFFPDAAQTAGIVPPKDPSEDEKRFHIEAESSYRDAVKRNYVNPWSDGSITGYFANQSDVSKEKKLPSSSIIVFFAPWCPHCQKLLHAWGTEKQLDPTLKDKIYLVQSFANDNSWKSAKEFCNTTGLKGDLCGKHLWLIDKDKSTSLIKTLGLYTIPRVIVTNPIGQAVVFDYQIDLNRPMQTNQDLHLLLEEAVKDQ